MNRFRRTFRFALQLCGFALALISLAQPRWGYTFQDVKRKGLDLLIAVDTSRSMLSNDVQPNRLNRVKLASQDLINALQGDRIGLIAFAGRAFLQAPLTIDYQAVVESINDLDTKTIPEGGSNISEAITLADKTYGKSAVGNRALIIFTDGEELNGDAVKTAQAAAVAGVRIFTVGVGTPEGSLIPINDEDGGTAFVKDAKGQVVKSKLDEKRLREIAQASGGFYLHLESGPRTMRQLFTEGLGKMQAAEMDVRLSRQPIERYEWPLGAGIVALAMSMLIGERKRMRASNRRSAPALAPAATMMALVLLSLQPVFAAAPGLEAYWDGKFSEAYQEFQQTLKAHPQSKVADKLQFDSGAAAYKMKEYGKALESFSQALLSRDTSLQGKTHYNLGNTLYQRGETQTGDDKKLGDWTNALQHYEQTLKLDPENKEAKDNYEYVKKKIEELKKKQQQQQPSPSPSKKQKNDKQDKQNQQPQSQPDQQQQDQQQQQQQDQPQQSESQTQPGTGQNEKQGQSQAKNEQQNKDQSRTERSPSPSSNTRQQQGRPSPSPFPSPGEANEKQDRESSSADKKADHSPAPGEGKNGASPSLGEGEKSGESPNPSATPAEPKKFAGEIKAASEETPGKPSEKEAQIDQAQVEKEGEMSERQAEALLQSMKDEEARVQLDERRAARRVYNDW